MEAQIQDEQKKREFLTQLAVADKKKHKHSHSEQAKDIEVELLLCDRLIAKLKEQIDILNSVRCFGLKSVTNYNLASTRTMRQRNKSFWIKQGKRQLLLMLKDTFSVKGSTLSLPTVEFVVSLYGIPKTLALSVHVRLLLTVLLIYN